MTRRLLVAAPLAVCIVAVTLSSSNAEATSECDTGTPMTAAGQTDMAFIDVNRDGVLNSDDCVVNGWGMVNNVNSTADADVCFQGTQGSNMPQILGCDGTNHDGMAMVDPGQGYGSVLPSMYGDPGIFFASSPFDSSNEMGSAGGNSGFPLAIRFGRVRDSGEGPIIGEGFLCNDLGPAVAADVRGVMGLVRFFMLESGGVKYQCVNVPLEAFDGFDIVTQLFPVCFPVQNGTAPLAYEGDPTVFAEIVLTGLPACGQGAPSANEWGLIALAAVLLVGGTWVLRRRAFADSLPAI